MMSIPVTGRLLAAALTAATLAAAGASSAHAAEAAHEHGHAVAAKPLPPGQRWASDATLREGMAAIRDAYGAKLGQIHRNELPPAGYKALAETTNQQVATIVANCKLAPEADAALHGIIGRIAAGTDAMAGANPREGAMQVVQALEAYGRTFQHPGWKPLKG